MALSTAGLLASKMTVAIVALVVARSPVIIIANARLALVALVVTAVVVDVIGFMARIAIIVAIAVIAVIRPIVVANQLLEQGE